MSLLKNFDHSLLLQEEKYMLLDFSYYFRQTDMEVKINRLKVITMFDQDNGTSSLIVENPGYGDADYTLSDLLSDINAKSIDQKRKLLEYDYRNIHLFDNRSIELLKYAYVMKVAQLL